MVLVLVRGDGVGNVIDDTSGDTVDGDSGGGGPCDATAKTGFCFM